MKCQQCEKPATFHITELTGEEEDKSFQELHLCEECARMYLTQPEANPQNEPNVLGALAQQYKVGQTAEELSRLDEQVCPVCGITFYEFRHVGRLGCPHDYICFADELEPLVLNIHGETKHVGKTPHKHNAQAATQQTDLIRLRREMQEAIEQERYERASELRDQIQKIEHEGRTGE
jgi:protein arginine kinase activator